MYNMEFSPPKPPPRLPPQQSKWFTVNPLTPEEQITEERPVLILKPFTAIPHISFKKVKLGCTKSCILYVQNPLDISQRVRVEKIPFDKGFSIEQDEFSLMAGEEKALTIVWAPEKSLSCRETVSFRSSTGCKTQAYLIGTAYSPKKVIQKKVIVAKTKKHHRKKNSLKTAKPCTISEKNIFPTIFKINEEKKENLDITNSASLSFLAIPESSNFKFLSTPESFRRKPGHVFPDSPFRRQTYTINSMLLHGRESEVLPLQVKESLSNVSIIDNSWRKSETGFTLNQSTCNFPNSFSSNVISLHSAVKRLPSEDNLNDSLENANVKYKTDLSINLNDSLTDTDAKCETVCFETTNIQDSVETYNIANKHFYFGVTPKQPMSTEKLELIQSNEVFSDKNKDISSFPDQGLNFQTKLIVSNNLQRMSSIKYPLSNDVDFKQPFDVKSRKSRLNFSDFLDDNFGLKSSAPVNHLPHSPPVSNPLWTKSLEVQSTQIGESPFECKNLMHEIQPTCNLTSANHVSSTSQNNEHSNILLLNGQLKTEEPPFNKKILSECDDMKSKVLKETKSSFMEIPCENSCVSSVTSENSRKHVKLSITKKNCEKKEKHSSFKAKVSKPGSLVTSKEALRKNSSVTSKTGVSIKIREKPSKFMPRKLCLTKPRMSESVVYHRNPFASMNIYYDERWIEKQEAAFTSWLNFVLTPNDEFSSEDVKVDSAKLWIESIKETSSLPAPTKEELSLKAYTAARNLNLLRKSSFSLYQSDEIVAVIKRIEKEVDVKRISIRKDRAIHADLGIKKNILEMLLSYNTLWLRIGLETVYGEVINLQNNSDVVGLSRFIIHRFLQNPEISSKFSHPAVVNYYKKGYEDDIQRFTLKKFLLLVFYLDTAKNSHLIKHNPCLFNKNSKYKASRDLLLVFSREYLSGEGDVTKHLRYLGYKVSYQQSLLEEFDYSVRNIAVDLRCGLRLGRVVELLLEDWTISQMLRINTLNRLTKIHNNDVILKALKNADIEIENNIEAKNITDGDREKTLDLLWQIVFKTQISKLINKELLKKENAFLFRSLKLRADFAAYNALRNHISPSDNHVISIHDSKLYKENEILQLLFQWCQNVCAHYGVKVHNFTSSFSDGRVLCLLLHHYHPNVLPYESIKFETSSNYFEEQMKEAETSENCPFFVQNGQSNSVLEKLLKNERDNLTLVFQKFKEVGHIPILSNYSDMSNTLPDEKVMVTLVSYINIRLMELSIEIRAARKILHAWRQYKLRKQHERLKLEIWAATIIQRSWKKYLAKKQIIKETEASIVIQSFWRMYAAKKELARLKYQKSLEYLSQNAIIIQTAYRGFSTRKLLLKHQQAATVIQTSLRKWLERSHFMKLKRIAIQIQQNYRAKIIGRAQQQKYVNLRKTVIKLQAIARGSFVRTHFKQVQYSTVKIQAYIRMWLLRKRYIKMKNSCITIQQIFRGNSLMKHYRQEYQNQRSAAIAVQKWYRAVRIHQHKVQCVIKIQTCIRRFLARTKYVILQQNVTKIQNWWHAIKLGRKTRLQYLHCYRSIVYVQSCVRKNIASRNYRRVKQFTVTIQKHVRGLIARRRYSKLKKNAVIIQNIWRAKQLARKTRSEYLEYRSNVILVQSHIRRFLALKEFMQKKHAIIVIQKRVRGLIARKRYSKLKNNTIIIQNIWRARKTRSEYLEYRSNVILVQSHIRRFLALKEFTKKKLAAIAIQKHIRGLIARKRYSKLKKNTLIIQNIWRARQLAQKNRSEYLAYRSNVILVQSLIRRFLALKEFMQKKHAIIVIQKRVRGLIARKRYSKLKKNTIIIQNIWRARQLARKTRSEYLEYRSNVILVQSDIRRFLALKEFTKKKLAAIAIQKHIRGLIARKRYSKLKKNTLIIQNIWRARQLAQKNRSEYLAYRSNVILVQSLIRRFLALKEFMQKKHAIIVIQKCVRGLIARKRYSKLKNNTIIIQTIWRARKTRSEYLEYRSNVILVQSHIRRFLALKEFTKKKLAAIAIQKHIRGLIARKRYSKLKKNTLIIQNIWRARQLAQKNRSEYLAYRSNVILVQSLIRRFLALKEFMQKKHAIIVIQKRVRGLIARKRYSKLKKNTIIIQNIWRARQLARKTRSEYLEYRSNVILVQSHIRRFLALKEFTKKKLAAIAIQKHIRGLIARKRYSKLKKNTLIIQNIWRARQLAQKNRSEYLAYRSNVILVQSLIRRFLALKEFMQKKHAIIVIQKDVRGLIARKRYSKLKNNTIIIQNIWRATVLGKRIRSQYLSDRSKIILVQSLTRRFLAHNDFQKKRHAAITIQRIFRAKLAGQVQRQKYIRIRENLIKVQAFTRSWLVRRHISKQHHSCTKIQSYVRMWLLRKKYIKARNACITIQQKFRAYVLKVFFKKEYQSQRSAAIIIQRWYRAVKIYQHKVQCVTKVQACVRRFLTRRKYMIQCQSVVRIQTWWRATMIGRIIRFQYLQYYKSIVCLQSLVRKYIATKNYRIIKQSAITVQKHVRGLIAKKKYSKLKKTTITIQNVWHAKQLTRKTRSEYLLFRSKVILVQSLIRRHFALQDYKRKKQAAITIQNYFRARVAGKKQRLQYINFLKNVIKLQAFARGILVRRRFKKQCHSAIQIQSYIRMWLLRTKYIKMKNSCTTIQQKLREYRIMKHYRQEYKDKRSAAITIQKWYRAIKMHQHKVLCVTQIQACVRRYLAARKYMILRQSVVKIQTWWQAILIGRTTRSHYLHHYRRVVYLQSFIRKWIALRTYRKMKESAITIQKYTRGFIARREFLQMKKSVSVIQNVWRAKLLARKIQDGDLSYSIGPLSDALMQRLGYVRLRNSVVQFQRASRACLKRRHASTVIQSYFRMWLVQQQFKRMKAALRIQACWRGFLIRRSISDKKILEARKKIQAADSSEAKKLKNRTSRSLELLLFKDVLLQNMLTALQELDVCTQLSPKCCERLVESGGLTILIRLVLSCNRSIPHMELIKLTTNILLNLAKYEKTVDNVWEEEDILMTILHLMKIFREKGAAIFTKCCSLLWIFSQDPNKAQVMTEDSSVIEQIRSFHYLLTRKQSMEQKRLVTKAFIASKTFNASVLSRTMNLSVFQKDSERDSLQIDPDWKLGTHRRREFKDPVIAVTWVMKSLGITSKGGFNL